jgi:uncharacterized protein YdhG (YjbR/CyaY superfamily)
MRTTAAKDVESYLAATPEAMRAALERLRQTIKAAAPQATEGISYHIPVYKQNGPLVGFAAFKQHCSFFVMGTSVMKAYKDELKAYATSKGTIRFPAEKPLPAALVKKLVKARIEENEGRKRAKNKK